MNRTFLKKGGIIYLFSFGEYRFFKKCHSIVKVLLISTICIAIARSMSIPFLAIYLTRNTTLSPASIGLIIGLGAIVGTFGGFLGGILSDKIGRSKVIILAFWTSVFVFIGFSMGKDVYVLLLMSIMNGLSFSFYSPVAKALIGDYTPPNERVRVFSLRYTLFNIGFAIGPLLGVVLGTIGGTLPFIITAVFYIILAIILQVFFLKYGSSSNVRTNLLLPEDEFTLKKGLRATIKDKALLCLVLAGILSFTVHGQMSVTLSLYLNSNFEAGVAYFSILLTINATVVILMQIPLTKWVETKNPLFGVIIGSFLFLIGELGFAFSQNLLFLSFAMVIFTIGEIFVIPSEYSMVDKITPDKMRGTYYGAHNLAELGNFIGPWIGGIILSNIGGTAMFLTFGVLAIINIFFYKYAQTLYIKKSQHINLQKHQNMS